MEEKPRQLIIHHPLLKRYLTELSKNPIYAKTLKSYAEKRYTSSDTGQSYRTLNSWDSSGLLLTLPNTKSKWRKFSIVEIIWIHIVKELRGFGFNKSKILKLKKTLFPDINNKGISDTSIFAQYIISVVAKRDVVLIVDAQGNGDFAIDFELLETERELADFPISYILISINKICADITGNENYRKKNQFVYIPNKKENELLNEIKNTENIKSANISIKENKISRVEYKNSLTPNKFKDILWEAQHDRIWGEIRIKMENGKPVYIEKVQKK